MIGLLVTIRFILFVFDLILLHISHFTFHILFYFLFFSLLFFYISSYSQERPAASPTVGETILFPLGPTRLTRLDDRRLWLCFTTARTVPYPYSAMQCSHCMEARASSGRASTSASIHLDGFTAHLNVGLLMVS
jgi:hypothetical protein